MIANYKEFGLTQKDLSKALMTTSEALLSAVMSNRNNVNEENILKLLLQNGADVNQELSDDDLTPLLFAAEFGHFDSVKLLLKYNTVNTKIL